MGVPSRHSQHHFPARLGFLAMLVLYGGCWLGGFKVERTIPTYVASQSGVASDTLVYFERQAVVRLRGERLQRVKIIGQQCAEDESLLFDYVEVTPDGEHALVYGYRSSHPGVLLDGGGTYLSTACWVDFARGIATPVFHALPAVRDLIRQGGTWKLGAGRLYHWDAYVGRAPHVTDLATERTSPLIDDRYGDCEVVEQAATATVACIDRASSQKGTLHVLRYELSAWPPRELERFAMPVERPAGQLKLSLAADGSHLAYYGSEPASRPANAVASQQVLIVLDLVRRERLFITREVRPSLIDLVAFAPDKRWIFIGESRDTQDGGGGRIAIRSMTGALEAEVALRSRPEAILPLSRGDRFWLVVQDEALLLAMPNLQAPRRSPPRSL